MIDWLEFLANQPEFERVQLGDVEAVKVPTYEAIYLAQRLAIGKGGTAYIEPKDEKPIQFPQPTPSVRVRDIRRTRAAGRDRSANKQITPLLAPSLTHVRNEFPEFFAREEKYITTKRYGQEDLGGLDQIHRVCLSASSVETDLGEGLTEYLVSLYLRRQGYIVDPFAGSLPGHGGPDLYAVALPELQTKLKNAGITGGGCYLAELELPKMSSKATRLPNEREALVIEVESAYDSGRFYAGKDEAEEYASDGWFDEGYGAMGFVEDRVANWEDRLNVGYITFNTEGTFTEVPCRIDYVSEGRVEETYTLVERVVKATLLKNKPLVELFEDTEAHSFYDVTQAVAEMSVDEILRRI